MVESCWTCDNRLLVDILAGLFGISAWLSVNAMYTQLPILVETAPEGWNLPSYLSILIQVANIGPVIYSVFQRYAPSAVRDSALISFIMMLGTASLLLMSFFYYQTTIVFGVRHSTPLFILTFCIALVGCTSSVLFIPFMNNYPEIHLVSYLVGEGLSGFIPSIISLVQGVGITRCVNKTIENGTVIKVNEMSPPLFSSQIFFLLMFLLMCASMISFFLLNKLPSCKTLKLRRKSTSATRSSTMETTDNNCLDTHLDNQMMNQIPKSTPSSLSPALYVGLLFLQSVISMFANGALPSIQSYSCLPYGNFAYHLAVNLANMANPAACFVAFFLPRTSLLSISVMSTMAAVAAVYNITTAAFSPEPPLQHQVIGIIVIVSSWVLCCGLVSYVKLSIAALFRREGGQGLFWYGAVTQAGAFVGSITVFYLINYAQLLKSYDPCR
ncbi:solute carrier family 52, riboflavin transporter, member 3-A-like isoform X2 [Lycorma delicatula]